MYAVIESGGKQHRVELGSEIQVDRLDVQPGDSITLDRVLLVADGDDAAIGQPVVDGASVSRRSCARSVARRSSSSSTSPRPARASSRASAPS